MTLPSLILAQIQWSELFLDMSKSFHLSALFPCSQPRAFLPTPHPQILYSLHPLFRSQFECPSSECPLTILKQYLLSLSILDADKQMYNYFLGSVMHLKRIKNTNPTPSF